MATFTTWEAFRTALKNAIQTHVEGEPFLMSASINDKAVRINSIDQAFKWLQMSYEMENLESGPAARVAYGRYRRFS